jgi:hypothetical protein
MTDLVSLFRNFIYRDLAFILGGSIVLLSTFYALRSCVGLSLPSLSVNQQLYFLFLFTVLAYVVGYTVQDFMALLPWKPTFTGYVFKPDCLWKCLYNRFTGSTWKEPSFAENTHGALRFAIRMNKFPEVPEPILRELDRIRSLKVFSMCVGGCSALSAFIWLAKVLCNRFAVVDWVPFGLLLAFGTASICLGWVKGLQEMQFYEALKAEDYAKKN